MRAKSITGGALQSKPIQVPDDKNDNILPINTHIPRVIQNGKSVVRFSGTDEYLTGPNTFDVGNGDYTTSLWWYQNGTGTVQGPHIGKWLDTSNYHIILAMYMVNSSMITITSTAEVSNSIKENLSLISNNALVGNAWNHITLVNDRSSGFTYYINGSAATITFTVSNTSTTDDINIDAALEIGRSRATGSSFTYVTAGNKIADLRNYAYAFSSDDVSDLYNDSLTQGKYVGDYGSSTNLQQRLKNYWTFGDTQGDVKSGSHGKLFDIVNTYYPDNAPMPSTDNQITNGDFSAALSSGWTVHNATGTGKWALSSGKAACSLSLSMLSSTSDDMVVGGLYKLSFDFGTESNQGNMTVMANLNTLEILDTAGHYEYIFRAHTSGGATSGLTFVSGTSSGESITVDNVELQRIPHNGLSPHNMEDDDFQSTSSPASTTKGRLV